MDKKAIKELRQKLLLNQQEFAKVMHVGKDTVSHWELGKQRPTAVHLRRMARLSKKAG